MEVLVLPTLTSTQLSLLNRFLNVNCLTLGHGPSRSLRSLRNTDLHARVPKMDLVLADFVAKVGHFGSQRRGSYLERKSIHLASRGLDTGCLSYSLRLASSLGVRGW